MNMTDNGKTVTIAVISDTHGFLRNEAVNFLKNADLILHAGDVDNGDCLDKIKQYGKFLPVLGNMDRGMWSIAIPETRIVEAAGKRIFMIHNLQRMPIAPENENIDAVIFGHTHMPELRWDKGIMYLNPGSAGPRRQDKPISMATMTIDGGQISAGLIRLIE